jgi:hypothetical protein
LWKAASASGVCCSRGKNSYPDPANRIVLNGGEALRPSGARLEG